MPKKKLYRVMNICGAPMEESIKDEVSKVSGYVKKKNDDHCTRPQPSKSFSYWKADG